MKELSFKESEEAMIKVLDNIQELIEESSLLLSNKIYYFLIKNMRVPIY